MTTSRSRSGASARSAASSVVFPVPPAPVTRMFLRERTASRSDADCASSTMPARASAASENPPARGTRTEIVVPLTETGGSTACTRMPAPSRTSTAGVASSMWRPPRAMSCTASARTSASSAVQPGSGSAPAPRSIQSPRSPFTKRSVTGPSTANTSSGPSRERSAPGRCTGAGREARGGASSTGSTARESVTTREPASRGPNARSVAGDTGGSRCHEGEATKGWVMSRAYEPTKAPRHPLDPRYGKSLPHIVVEEDSIGSQCTCALPVNERGRHPLGGTGAASAAQGLGGITSAAGHETSVRAVLSIRPVEVCASTFCPHLCRHTEFSALRHRNARRSAAKSLCDATRRHDSSTDRTGG